MRLNIAIAASPKSVTAAKKTARAIATAAKLLAKTKSLAELQKAHPAIEAKAEKLQKEYEELRDKIFFADDRFEEIENPTAKQTAAHEASQIKLDAQLAKLDKESSAAAIKDAEYAQAIQILTKTTPADLKRQAAAKERAQYADVLKSIKREDAAARRYAKNNGVNIETARRDIRDSRAARMSPGNILGRLV